MIRPTVAGWQRSGAFRLALEERTRERVPLDWAQTQTNVASALRILGEREMSTDIRSGTKYLEEALAGYRLALEEWTRERVPLQWAATQNNLGAALATLGARESGTARLEEAAESFSNVLRVDPDNEQAYNVLNFFIMRSCLPSEKPST